jgi:hypothetical protein
MRRGLRNALFAASIFGLPLSASADMLRSIPLYGHWSGGAFADDNSHKFNACTASVPYQSGIIMFVSVNRGMGWTIGFRSEEWNLQPHQQIPLSISFDGQAPWSGSAIALDPHMVTVPMADDSRLITSFRGAYKMAITAAGRVYPFNLDGTSRLMISLVQCVQTQLAIEAGKPIPGFAPQPPPAPRIANNIPPPPVPPPSAQYELLATRLASNLLLETKIPNARLLPTDLTPVQFRGRGVVWTSDAGVGAVILFPAAVAGKDAQQVTTWLISNDASACKGDFVSGRANELVDNTIVARSTTECRDSGGFHVHRYFTIPALNSTDSIVFEVDTNTQEKTVPAPDSVLSDTNFQAAAVRAAYVKQ